MKVNPTKSSLFQGSALLTVLPLYLLVIRPWMLHWGATAAEVTGPWPGDEFIPTPGFASTRALTIQARAAGVWAWLVQMGQDRAGTYSYNSLEHLMGIDTLNIDWIVPRFQQIAVGDQIRMATPARFGGRGPGIVMDLEPERTLVLGHGAGKRGSTTPRATWAFLLSPVDDGSTRLIIRARVAGHLPLAEKVAGFLVEPAHFLMERRMMLGIKQRAETTVYRQRTGELRPPLTAAL